MGVFSAGQVIVMRSGVTLLGRLVGNQGVPVTQVSLSTIQYALTDLGSPTGNNPVTGALTSLAIATVIFDQLQQSDPRWRRDNAVSPGEDGLWGYNFRATLPASLFTSPNRQHVDVVVTPLVGEPLRAWGEWQPLKGYA